MAGFPIECSVDWLTISLRDDAHQPQRLRWGRAIARTVAALGQEGKDLPWTWKGYVGRHVEGLSWGRRYDGQIIVATGLVAHMIWPETPDTFTHCSRIDLALTMHFAKDNPGYAKEMVEAAEMARQSQPAARRRKLCLIDGRGDGDTLYIGSRRSEQFGRLYDKWRESGRAEYTNAWRAECEFKDKAAVYALGCLRRSDSVGPTIAASVVEWWRRRGVELPVDVANAVAIVPKQSRVSKGDEQRLLWLSTQVAGVVERLICSVGREAVYSALFGEGESRGTAELNPKNEGE